MRYTAPLSVSPEAQEFINSAPPLESAEITSEAIQSIRDLAATLYQPAVDRVSATYSPMVEETIIRGVPVQRVSSSPDVDENGPVLFYCFGGGFVTGSPTSDQILTVPLACKTGAVVYAPHYRLAPEHSYPAASDDCFAVYEALLGQVGEERIAIAGESAGGNLALSVLIRSRQANLPMPKAAALFSPFVDFSCASDTLTTLNGIDPTLGPVGPFVNAYAAGCDVSEPALSPINAEYDSSFPPVLITTGTRDLLLSESARLSTCMRQAGVNVSLHVWEGMWHVFEFYPEIPEAQQSLNEVAGFLSRHLDGTENGAISGS